MKISTTKSSTFKPGLKLFLFALTICFSSCNLNLILSRDLTAQNRQKISLLKVGISREDVLKIMGTETVKTLEDALVNSPYRTESIKDDKGKDLEVLFFYTDEKHSDAKITDDELTPVVLRNEKVEGWGRTYLASIAPIYQLRYFH